MLSTDLTTRILIPAAPLRHNSDLQYHTNRINRKMEHHTQLYAD